jgi:hypothetical protein
MSSIERHSVVKASRAIYGSHCIDVEECAAYSGLRPTTNGRAHVTTASPIQ